MKGIFFVNIKEPTLFLHYIYNQQNADWIARNEDYIDSVLRRHCDNNRIVYIANNDISIKLNHTDVLFVEPDDGDIVARQFLDKLPLLKEFLNKIPYDPATKQKNLAFYKNKMRKKKLLKPFNKMIEIYNRYTKQVYVHKHRVSYD